MKSNWVEHWDSSPKRDLHPVGLFLFIHRTHAAQAYALAKARVGDFERVLHVSAGCFYHDDLGGNRLVVSAVVIGAFDHHDLHLRGFNADHAEVCLVIVLLALAAYHHAYTARANLCHLAHIRGHAASHRSGQLEFTLEELLHCKCAVERLVPGHKLSAQV